MIKFLFWLLCANQVGTSGKGIELVSQDTFNIVYGQKNSDSNTLEDYFDLGCEHCIHFYRHIFPAIRENFCKTGKLVFIFKPYPVHIETVAFMSCCESLDAPQKRILFETLMELDNPSVDTIEICMQKLKVPYPGVTRLALQSSMVITQNHKFKMLPVMFFNGIRLSDHEQDNIMQTLKQKYK